MVLSMIEYNWRLIFARPIRWQASRSVHTIWAAYFDNNIGCLSLSGVRCWLHSISTGLEDKTQIYLPPERRWSRPQDYSSRCVCGVSRTSWRSRSTASWRLSSCDCLHWERSNMGEHWGKITDWWGCCFRAWSSKRGLENHSVWFRYSIWVFVCLIHIY
jgi:hypothetical protein